MHQIPSEYSRVDQIQMDQIPQVIFSIENYCGQYFLVYSPDDIAPTNTKVQSHENIPFSSWKLHQECDAQDKFGRWYPATITHL